MEGGTDCAKLESLLDGMNSFFIQLSSVSRVFCRHQRGKLALPGAQIERLLFLHLSQSPPLSFPLSLVVRLTITLSLSFTRDLPFIIQEEAYNLTMHLLNCTLFCAPIEYCHSQGVIPNRRFNLDANLTQPICDQSTSSFLFLLNWCFSFMFQCKIDGDALSTLMIYCITEHATCTNYCLIVLAFIFVICGACSTVLPSVQLELIHE